MDLESKVPGAFVIFDDSGYIMQGDEVVDCIAYKYGRILTILGDYALCWFYGVVDACLSDDKICLEQLHVQWKPLSLLNPIEEPKSITII
jgi:hypothetical protein